MSSAGLGSGRPEKTDATILYGLDSPKYHLLELDAINRFSGCVLPVDGRSVTSLIVSRGRSELGRFPVETPREAIGRMLPNIPGSGRCGFDFDLFVDAAPDELVFDMVFGDGSRERLFTYDILFPYRNAARLSELKKVLGGIDLPDGSLVCLTQGHEDVKSYSDSIIPFILDIERYVRSSGLQFGAIRTVLDFGCGSGRALLGWYADDRKRTLFGCDINERLISWAETHLPGSIRLHRNGLNPPLPYDSCSFDMIQAISVFTHLKLDTQKRWIQEFRRILKPGGKLLVTLHGEIYARLSGISVENFSRMGYIEHQDPAEGSNQFSTFHAYPFVQDLFSGFEVSGYFPMGSIENKRILFPVAALQDVYLLSFTGGSGV